MGLRPSILAESASLEQGCFLGSRCLPREVLVSGALQQGTLAHFQPGVPSTRPSLLPAFSEDSCGRIQIKSGMCPQFLARSLEFPE